MEDILRQKINNDNVVLRINDYNFVMATINKKNNVIKNLTDIYSNYVKNNQFDIHEIPEIILKFSDVINKENVDDDLNIDLILNFILKSIINKEYLNLNNLEAIYVDKLINNSLLLLKKNIESKPQQNCWCFYNLN